MWYSMGRHSVDVKIMCRFPKHVLLVKAWQFQQEYVVACLERGIAPEAVIINERWVNGWLVENRLTQTKPNRKWSVSKTTCSERLCQFGITIHQLRKLVLLAKGYDPHMRNVDQSPCPPERGR